MRSKISVGFCPRVANELWISEQGPILDHCDWPPEDVGRENPLHFLTNLFRCLRESNPLSQWINENHRLLVELIHRTIFFEMPHSGVGAICPPGVFLQEPVDFLCCFGYVPDTECHNLVPPNELLFCTLMTLAINLDGCNRQLLATFIPNLTMCVKVLTR